MIFIGIILFFLYLITPVYLLCKLLHKYNWKIGNKEIDSGLFIMSIVIIEIAFLLQVIYWITE